MISACHFIVCLLLVTPVSVPLFFPFHGLPKHFMEAHLNLYCFRVYLFGQFLEVTLNTAIYTRGPHTLKHTLESTFYYLGCIMRTLLPFESLSFCGLEVSLSFLALQVYGFPNLEKLQPLFLRIRFQSLPLLSPGPLKMQMLTLSLSHRYSVLCLFFPVYSLCVQTGEILWLCPQVPSPSSLHSITKTSGSFLLWCLYFSVLQLHLLLLHGFYFFVEISYFFTCFKRIDHFWLKCMRVVLTSCQIISTLDSLWCCVCCFPHSHCDFPASC